MAGEVRMTRGHFTMPALLFTLLLLVPLSSGEVVSDMAQLGSLPPLTDDIVISDSALTTLTGTALAPIQHVTKLKFVNNTGLKQIDSNALSGLIQLQELQICETNVLEEFPNLSGLAYLATVVIEYSQISFIPEAYVRSLPSLQTLKLPHNQFTSFPLAIGMIPNLRILNLDNNNIEYVNVSGLNNYNVQLNELRMTSNSMKTFPAISAFPALIDLYLTNNLIESAPWSHASSEYHTTVTDLPLSTLLLDSNPLSAPADFSLFQHTSYLGIIVMNSCNLTAIPLALKSATRLKWMYFTNNSITDLPADILSASAKIEKIYLNGNRLTTLPYEAFNGLDDLEEFDIRDNLLTTISSGILHESRNFNVYMTGNPLQCDRSLCWIKDFTPSATQAFSLTLGNYPCTNLQVVTFDVVEETDLGCSGPLTLSGNTVSAAVFEKTSGNDNGNLYSGSTLQTHASSLVVSTNHVDPPGCALGCLLHGAECTGFAVDAAQKKCWLMVKG